MALFASQHVLCDNVAYIYYIVVFLTCTSVVALSTAIRMLILNTQLKKEVAHLKKRELGYQRLLYWTVHKFENTSHKGK